MERERERERETRALMDAKSPGRRWMTSHGFEGEYGASSKMFHTTHFPLRVAKIATVP